MKASMILFSIIGLSALASVHQWDMLGPDDVHVNNFDVVYFNLPLEVLSTNDGILIHDGNSWVEYSYASMPAWKVLGLDPNNLLVLLADGSWSDGVYKFNLTSHLFEIVQYIAFPTFLEYADEEGAYYAGGKYGVWKSLNGTSFTSLPYFEGKDCLAMAFFENHYVVSAISRIHYSSDFGETWAQSESGVPYIPDMCFHDNATLYGIFPDDTYSSGLWKSTDFGETWSAAYYNMFMSAVGMDNMANIFAGWESDGIALYDPIGHSMTDFNAGLPDLHINKITHHPDVDAVNIVACTDMGAYLLTDYLVGVEENWKEFSYGYLHNYPNPFKESTTLVFSLQRTRPITISIFNALGEDLCVLYEGVAQANREYEIVLSANELSQGIYFCELQGGEKILARKKLIVLE